MTQLIIPTLKNQSEEKLFPAKDCFFPKVLTEINGEALLRVVLKNIVFNINISSIILIADNDILTEYSLDKVCDFGGKPDLKIVPVEGITSGALCTILLAIDLINKNEDVLVANNDIIHRYNIQNSINYFKKKEAEAGVVTFRSAHPKWSYVSLDNEEVIMAAEKEVISNNAIAGIYWFQRGETMIEMAKDCMINMFHKNKNYYLSGLINSYVIAEKKVLTSAINESAISHLNSIEKVKDYIRDSKSYPKRMISLIIPAAGEGSRFAKAKWKDPKPLIDIDGKAMIEHVIEDNAIDIETDIYIAIQKKYSENFKSILKRFERLNLIEINTITKGTACTVQRVLENFSSEKEFVVANSDQICSKSTLKMIRHAQESNLDGCIMCFKEPSLDEKWSYVKINRNNYVEKVAEKKAISDLATVGIYYFKSSLDYLCAYSQMIEQDDKVNGEFYTCPVYNYLLALNKKIGIYLISKEEMFGMGTPEDLNLFIKKKGYPRSKSYPEN